MEIITDAMREPTFIQDKIVIMKNRDKVLFLVTASCQRFLSSENIPSKLTSGKDNKLPSYHFQRKIVFSHHSHPNTAQSPDLQRYHLTGSRIGKQSHLSESLACQRRELLRQRVCEPHQLR
jgi:hypothetical protein